MREPESISPKTPKKKPKIDAEENSPGWEVYLKERAFTYSEHPNDNIFSGPEFQGMLFAHITQRLNDHLAQEKILPGSASFQSKTYSAALALLQNKTALAIQGLLEAIQIYPNYLQAHYWLLVSYYRMGLYDNILKHVEHFDLLNITTEAHYVSPLYAHLSLFTADQIQAQHLYLALPDFPFSPSSEFFLYYALAKKNKGQSYQDDLAKAYLLRARACFFNNYIGMAYVNYVESCKLSSRYLESFSGKMLCQVVLGDYQSALDQSIQEILAFPNQEGKKIPVLQVASLLCLQFQNPSRARFFMDEINLILSSPLQEIEFCKLKLRLFLQDERPYWPLLNKTFQQYINAFDHLSLEEQDRFDALENLFPYVNQCIQRYFRMGEMENTRYAISLILEFCDRRLKISPPLNPFERSKDRLYLRYLMILIKLYSQFPDSESSNDLTPLQEEVEKRMREIPHELATRPLFTENPSPDIQAILKHMRLLCQIASVIKGKDFGLGDVIKQKCVPSPPTAEEKDEEEEESAADFETEQAQNLDLSTLDDLYSDCFSNLLHSISAKPEFLTPFELFDHFQKLLTCKKIAVQHSVNAAFDPLRMRMLKLVTADEEPGLVSEALNRLILSLSAELFKIYNHLDQMTNDELLRVFFRAQLVDTGQFFYIQYLSESNKLFSAFISNRELSAAKNILNTQNALAPLMEFCCEARSYHSEDSTLMSIKISHALQKFRRLTHQFYMKNAMNLDRFLQSAQYQRMTHPLDVSYSSDALRYSVPFPAHLLSSVIQLAGNLIISEKNLSAHVLTLLFSLPEQGDENAIRAYHLHLPLFLGRQNESLISGINETKSHVLNLEEDILERIRRGHGIAKKHTSQHKPDSCEVIPEGKLPTQFVPLEHMHSEQYFYAWLCSQMPSSILDGIQKDLPDGHLFQPGATLLMLSLDTASLRSSCHPCRLSTLSVQNDADDFVGVFTAFLRKKGFHVGNNILKCISRIIAAKENGCDKNLPKHKNPETKEVSHLHNCAIYQTIQPKIFVSGASHKAFKPQ